MKNKKRICAPQQATTNAKLCAMPRDNVEWRGHWMMVDEVRVTVAEQKMGEDVANMTTMPRATFDRFVHWYTTGVWPARKKPARPKADS